MRKDARIKYYIHVNHFFFLFKTNLVKSCSHNLYIWLIWYLIERFCSTCLDAHC